MTPPRWCIAALGLLATVAACRGGPPGELAGFRVGSSQARVLATAADYGGFTCHLRGTRPSLAVCEGNAQDGLARVVVRDGVTSSVTLAMERAEPQHRRTIRKLTRRWGDAAWKDRPLPHPDSVRGYHTLWLDRDSTRSITSICAHPRLSPPCTFELAVSSPATIQATLDSLLGIIR